MLRLGEISNLPNTTQLVRGESNPTSKPAGVTPMLWDSLGLPRGQIALSLYPPLHLQVTVSPMSSGTGRVRRKRKLWMNGLRWWRRCYLCPSLPPKEASSLSSPSALLSLKDKRKGHKVGCRRGGVGRLGGVDAISEEKVSYWGLWGSFWFFSINKSLIWDGEAVVRGWAVEPKLSTEQLWAVARSNVKTGPCWCLHLLGL